MTAPEEYNFEEEINNLMKKITEDIAKIPEDGRPESMRAWINGVEGYLNALPFTHEGFIVEMASMTIFDVMRVALRDPEWAQKWVDAIEPHLIDPMEAVERDVKDHLPAP